MYGKKKQQMMAITIFIAAAIANMAIGKMVGALPQPYGFAATAGR
jgi:hypothetical protein